MKVTNVVLIVELALVSVILPFGCYQRGMREARRATRCEMLGGKVGEFNGAWTCFPAHGVRVLDVRDKP